MSRLLSTGFRKFVALSAACTASGPNAVHRARDLRNSVLSVNVGLPKDVPWQGRVVRTAIWKVPVEGRRMVRRLNLEGDDQADRQGHGGEHRAVFVYQIEAYHYWQAQLGRDDFVISK